MEVGLVCVFSPDPISRRRVEDMAGHLLPVETSQRTGIDSGPVSLRARVVPWIKKPFAEDPESGTHLVLLGHAWLGLKLVSAEMLMRSFLRDGEAALTGLGGSFAILVWQPRTQTLLVLADRLGTKKLYVWQSAGAILLATELRALLGHPSVPKTLNDGALEQFLITSHLVDHCSLIRDVNVLRPGTLTRISHEGMASRTYWVPKIIPAPDDGLDAWADRLAEVLSSAVRVRCGDTLPLLPLSGGLDSRSIAAFIPSHLTSRTITASFGHHHCNDVRYGRGVAHALGAHFQFLRVPQTFFQQYLEPVHALCDGEVSIEALPMYRLMTLGNPGQTLLMGFLGDVLSSGHLLGVQPNQSLDEGLERLWHKLYQAMGFSEQLLERVLVPDRYQACQGSTRNLMRAAINKAEAETLDEKALLVELHHRQSRYISYFGRMLSARYHVETPFLDVEVLDTFLAMPLVHRADQRAYRRMLIRHAPRLAAVPEMKTHKPVTYADRYGLKTSGASSAPRARLPAELQWRLDKLKNKFGQSVVALSGGWLGPHNRDYYVHHDESIRRVDPTWFRSRLNQDSLLDGIFQKAALNQLMDEHMAHKADHSIRINNVISILEWRKQVGF